MVIWSLDNEIVDRIYTLKQQQQQQQQQELISSFEYEFFCGQRNMNWHHLCFCVRNILWMYVWLLTR